MERSDRMWSIGRMNSKPLQYSCLENPMNSRKMQKDRTLRDELLRLLLPAAGPGLGRGWLLPAAAPGLGLRVAPQGPYPWPRE